MSQTFKMEAQRDLVVDGKAIKKGEPVCEIVAKKSINLQRLKDMLRTGAINESTASNTKE